MTPLPTPPYRAGTLPHPAIANALRALEAEEAERKVVQLAWNSDDARYWRRWFRCLCLAPTIEIMDALLRGEAVPLELLDQAQVRRYGLR